MTKRDLIDYCLTYPSAFEDYPFDSETAIMKHSGNNKMFALISESGGAVRINLKCEPMRADFLRSVFVNVTPGWHMNKVHWNTVTLDGDVPLADLYEMIQHSFDLTKPKERKRKPKQGSQGMILQTERLYLNAEGSMIREIDDKDLERALELVNKVFSEFVAVDYSERGRTTFENYLKHKNEEVASDLKTGRKKMWAYFRGGEIIGVISTRDISHISLMFVDKNYHRQGIARELFNTVLEDLKKSGSITQVTVNSSPYAVHVYERLGFIRTGQQQENDGIIFIPMAKAIEC